MGIEVLESDPEVDVRVGEFRGSADEWDAFVRSRPGWTPFHLHGWKGVIEEVFGHDCSYLAAHVAGGGTLEAVLPLVRVRSHLFGDFLVSMPFLNYGGPLGSGEGVRALAARAEEMARAAGTDLLELRSRRPLPLDLPVSHRKITVVLDLPGDPETLWDDLKGKVRSQVRRPRKAGMTARLGPDQLGPFYEVFARHMRDLGTPALPLPFFEALRETFPEEVRFGCVYAEEVPVAAGCGFRWAEEFEMTWASALMGYSRQAPNMLLYWAFMERSIEEGCHLFNFGRCSPDSGTHRFKSQWGSRDEQLHWYQRASNEVDGTPSPDDEGWAWAPRLWRRLPLPVAKALGPRIVKYIP